MIAALLAASFTFSASATGLEKGAPVEFFLAGPNTDRDYETFFVTDLKPAAFCRELKARGFPVGRSPDSRACLFWPVGPDVTISPPLSDFIDIKMPDGLTCDKIVCTGGLRDVKGAPIAESEQPYALFSLYTLAQSPLLFNGIYPQGVVYNAFTVKKVLKKGQKQTFTLSWDDKTKPTALSVVFTNGQATAQLMAIRKAAEKSEIDLTAGFSPTLTIAEATAIAQALNAIDSRAVKVNGRRDGDFFYRAFTPMVKWRDRQERLQQPFELTVTENGEKLIYIEEDWKVEGIDPKLTEKEIALSDTVKYQKTDTCFIFAPKDMTVGRLTRYFKLFPKSVRNWYVYGD